MSKRYPKEYYSFPIWVQAVYRIGYRAGYRAGQRSKRKRK